MEAPLTTTFWWVVSLLPAPAMLWGLLARPGAYARHRTPMVVAVRLFRYVCHYLATRRVSVGRLSSHLRTFFPSSLVVFCLGCVWGGGEWWWRCASSDTSATTSPPGG